jgi:capping protein beta
MVEALQTNLAETAAELVRFLPPKNTALNIDRLCASLPELARTLRTAVPVPSVVISAGEAANGKGFLTCELVRVEDGNGKAGYRCPWNGKFYTANGETLEALEAHPIHELEAPFNEALSTYVSLYYGSSGGEAVSSAFVVESEPNLKVALLIKKKVDELNDEQEGNEDGSNVCSAVWDSLHVLEAVQLEGVASSFSYRHSATLMLSFDSANGEGQTINLAGHLSRVQEQTMAVEGASQHLVNVGRLLEEMESRLRGELQTVYFGRPHDAVNEVRRAVPDGFLRNQNDLRDEMMAKLAQRRS